MEKIRTADEFVVQAMSSIDNLDIPVELQISIANHQKNIMNLATLLLESGKDSEFIGKCIEEIVESYKSELIRTIMALKGGGNEM